MADYFTHFAAELITTTDEEQGWVRNQIRFFDTNPSQASVQKFHEKFDLSADDFWPDFDVVEEGEHFYFSGDNRNAGSCAELLHQFLKEFRPESFLHFATSYTCSKDMPGGFGGGAFFITKEGADFVDSNGWIQEKINNFQSGEPEVQLPIPRSVLNELAHKKQQVTELQRANNLERERSRVAESRVTELKRAIIEMATRAANLPHLLHDERVVAIPAAFVEPKKG